MADQRAIPASFLRGGTSKGLFFLADDLPSSPEVRDSVLRAAIGSPDPFGRQLDGMGGGVSSLSKVMVVRTSARPGIDVDYRFQQIGIDVPVVDGSSNCGNLTAGVAVFAVDRGLVRLPDGPSTVVLYNENTGKRVDAHLVIRGGRAAVSGDLVLDGVAGSGAPIRLDFTDPGGSATGKLLPTGQVVDALEMEDGVTVRFSLIDATNPAVFVPAGDLGLSGTEPPAVLARQPGLLARLEQIRRRVGEIGGVRDSTGAVPQAIPRVAVVGPAAAWSLLSGTTRDADEADIQIRMLSMGQPHLAIPLTGALCAAVAARIQGTVVHDVVGDLAQGEMLRIAHASGTVSVLGEVRQTNQSWRALHASVMRTARTLMEGTVLVPETAPLAAE